MEQYSQEWWQARKFKYTSSNIHKLCTDPKTKADKEAGVLSQTAMGYIIEKITEELDGFLPDFNNDAMAWGAEQEEQAAKWYRKIKGVEISEAGFCEYSDVYGGSPDRKVVCPTDGAGGLEIKCPYNSANHIKHCLIDSEEYFKKYHEDKYWQCVSHIITLNAAFCDFVSFDPRIDNDLGFFCFRLYRNEDEIKFLLSRIEKAEEVKRALKLQLGIDVLKNVTI